MIFSSCQVVMPGDRTFWREFKQNIWYERSWESGAMSRNRLHDKKRIKLSQETYVHDILQRFGMEKSNSVLTPFDTKPKRILGHRPMNRSHLTVSWSGQRVLMWLMQRISWTNSTSVSIRFTVLIYSISADWSQPTYHKRWILGWSYNIIIL